MKYDSFEEMELLLIRQSLQFSTNSWTRWSERGTCPEGWSEEATYEMACRYSNLSKKWEDLFYSEDEDEEEEENIPNNILEFPGVKE